VDRKPRVLFLCTPNAARSQMAEGILRDFSKGTVEVYSAGTEPTGVHPLAVGCASRDEDRHQRPAVQACR